MKIYLVGGAVRDSLLGLPVHEKDYVVVGATPEEMTRQGFKPVGKDFPVFLHPKTHEEYALARTERKIAKGHQGFAFYADPAVTLEEDLKRRDLTINAIAQDENGMLIDPYQGQQDLKDHVLRHVSPAFSEDPLRVLRVARFAAYLGKFNFNVAPETLDLMRQHALNELSDERVWQELYRALQTDYPEKFFETLKAVDGLHSLFEGSCDVKGSSPLIRFASLPRYLRTAPKKFEDLAHLVRAKIEDAAKFDTFSTQEKVMFLRSLDYFRQKERLDHFLEVCNLILPDFTDYSIKKALTLLRQLNRGAIAKQAKDPQTIPSLIKQAEEYVLNPS